VLARRAPSMAVWGPGIVVPKMENVGSQFLSLRQRLRKLRSPRSRSNLVGPCVAITFGTISGLRRAGWAGPRSLIGRFSLKLCTAALRYRVPDQQISGPRSDCSWNPSRCTIVSVSTKPRDVRSRKGQGDRHARHRRGLRGKAVRRDEDALPGLPII
jgi:hypothetical protein